jgi:hypothetical protein
MKKLATFFNFVGFCIQYLFPIVIFGDVIPYTRDGIGKCLTAMGYIAIALLVYFILKKFKEWLLQKPKSLKRAVILSLFPVAWWLIVFLGLDWLSAFMLTFSHYWDKVIFFIILGRAFYCLSEAMQDMTR